MSAKKLRVKYETFDTSTILLFEVPEPISISKNRHGVAMNEAMGNPLIINKIIECSSYPEWKTCRLLNRTWKNLTSKIMLKRDCSMVKIKYDVNRKVFRRSSHSHCQLDLCGGSFVEGHTRQQEVLDQFFPHEQQQQQDRDEDLSSLNRMLEKSIDFPCTDFTFEVGDLEETQAQRFFTIYGQYIRTLDLRFRLYGEGSLSTSQQVFCKLLTRQLPNVEKLSIRSFYYIRDSIVLALASLPASLKIFSCLDKSSTTQAIMKNAPNLHTIKVPKMCDVQWVTKAGRVGLVRQLVCDNACKADDLIEFVNATPQLSCLSFKINSDYARDSPLYRKQLATAFVKLLESTKDTLKNLNLGDLGSFHEIIQLPHSFSKLETLKIGLSRFFPQKCFPGQINFQTTFPFLSTLDCTDLGCNVDDNWIKYFPPSSPTNNDDDPDYDDAKWGFVIPTVQTLKVPDYCTECWMKKLHGLVPNFKNLTLVGKEHFPQMLPQIFTLWSHLQRLDIHMRKFCSLDFAMTGIPLDVCQQRLSHSSYDNVDMMRFRPSILDVKGLRILRILLGCPCGPKELPLSRVSEVFAFKLMPNLKVIFQFDHNWYSIEELKQICAAIPPSVNIRHKKSSWRSAEEDDEGAVNHS